MSANYGERLLEFMAVGFSNPLIADLIGELASRQPKSAAKVEALKQRSVSNCVLWPFHAIQLPTCIDTAEGGRVTDIDGNQYIDLFLGFGTQALHGHNHPYVTGMVKEQLGRTVGNGYFHDLELKYTELMAEMVPHREKWAFLHSGTDAMTAAVRLARAKTGKKLIIKFEGAIHGTQDWAMHNTFAFMHGNPAVPFPPRTGDGFEAVSYALGTVRPDETEVITLANHDPNALEIIERRKDDIAAVLGEPADTAFPFEAKSVPFMRNVAKRCKALGVLFILDECQTGFRCGQAGASATHDIPADLIVYGKVLSGLGIPFSAVAGRADLLDMACTSGLALTDYGQKTTLMTTHMGNHIAMLASYASLKLLHDKGDAYYDEVRLRKGILTDRMTKIREDHQIPIHLVGYGDFNGSFLFIDEDREINNARDLAHAANPVAALTLSLMLRRAGFYTYSLPFLFLGGAHERNDIEHLAKTVEQCVLEMKSAGIPFSVPR